MLNLSSTDSVRLVSAAAGALEVHASWVDLSGTTVTPGRLNTSITTATTTTIVPAPSAGVIRNVKGIYVTNVSSTVSQRAVVEHFDGTLAADLMGFTLTVGENMTFDEDGHWTHRDAQGAEYPPSGLGQYGGYVVPFFKTGSAPEGAGEYYCSSKDAGFPGSWSPGTPGINGRTTDGATVADAGCIPIRNAATGANYITGANACASAIAQHVFFDCLWVNTGIAVTTTTAQNITMGTLPARDALGTTDGVGCKIALLFTGAGSNASTISNSTISYTNSEGTAGRTATLVATTGSQIPTTPASGLLVFFSLAAGDTGVRSIQSITLGTSLGAGSVSLMIVRIICSVPNPNANTPASVTFSGAGVRIYNGTCMLHSAISSSTTSTRYSAELTIQEK